jgi:hypothetical protein
MNDIEKLIFNYFQLIVLGKKANSGKIYFA